LEEECTLLHLLSNPKIFTMKKIYIILMLITLICNLKSQNNTKSQYVSTLFKSAFSQSIQINMDTQYQNNICATHDSLLFIIHARGFGNPSHKGYAKISILNVITGTEKNSFISPPPEFTKNGGNLNRIWIWAIAATDSLLLLALDNEIWIYHFADFNDYEHFKTISIKDVSQLEIVNNDLHAFVENGVGFDWYKVNLSHFEVKKIKQLVLKNNFFLQIAPVKLIAINNNALYFLQRNEPTIEKYTLTGELLANYIFNIPNWNNIPEHITQQLDVIKDVTKQSYAFSKFSIFDYNFMHLFYVFSCERFLMIAIDENNNAKTYITPFFIQIIGDKVIVEPYSVKLPDNEKFENNYFPFLTEGAEENLIFAPLNDYIVQLNRSTNVPWQNKTQKEFQQKVDLFHRDHEPIEKIETYKFIKNYIPVESVNFLDYDNSHFTLNDLKKDKAIFIFSQYPYCSSCLKFIWNYFSNITLQNVELFNVASDCPTYLQKKENIKEVNAFLKTDYTPLFIDTKELNPEMKLLLTQQNYPLVILFDKKLQHIEVISSKHIIGDFMGNLSPSFISTINNFVEN